MVGETILIFGALILGLYVKKPQSRKTLFILMGLTGLVVFGYYNIRRFL